MITKPKILVFGATGQVGGAVLPHLKANPSVEVIAAARNPEKAAYLGVSVVHLDLDLIETIEPALKDIDRAFLVTGYSIDMMRQSKDFLNPRFAHFRPRCQRPRSGLPLHRLRQ
jgi:NAD(P)H dehydrogenase (quinone)